MSEHILVKKHFEEKGFVRSNIESYDSIIEWRLQKLVDELSSASPAVLPAGAESVEFKFGRIGVEPPKVIEADGVEHELIPMEARLRDLTYSGSVYLEVFLFINGKEKESAEVKIFDLPIMLKSKLCYLNELGGKELVAAGEDPNDPGSYFIINGTERVLILLEDLAPNTIFAELGTGAITHQTRIYSTSGTYSSLLKICRKKDGTLIASFSGAEIPVFVLIKALGITKDKEVLDAVGLQDDDVLINMYDFTDIKTKADAKEYIAKKLKVFRSEEQKQRRLDYLFDNILLPHISDNKKDRYAKALFLGRMANRLLLLKQNKVEPDQKDHYANKRIRMAGDLFEELLRTHLKSFVNDLLYVFQRGVRRGKILPISTMVQSRFLTDRINSAMATGSWTRGRQGVSQRLERTNAIATLAHLQRVSSLLTTTQENFAARELHPTQFGKICPIDSPEGKNIGLRKHLTIMADITSKPTDSEKLANLKEIMSLGVTKINND